MIHFECEECHAPTDIEEIEAILGNERYICGLCVTCYNL